MLFSGLLTGMGGFVSAILQNGHGGESMRNGYRRSGAETRMDQGRLGPGLEVWQHSGSDMFQRLLSRGNDTLEGFRWIGGADRNKMEEGSRWRFGSNQD